MENLRSLFLRHIAQTSSSPLAIQIDRAEGVYLFDAEGKQYLDMISGISVSNLGHCHPLVVESVIEQTKKFMHLLVYGELVQSPQVKLAELLCSLLPPSLQSVYFVNSGAEAVEGAMKLCKRYTGKRKIIAFKNAYHGSTQGALSIMGDESMKQAYRPLLPDIRMIRINEEEDLKDITENTACVILEPVQGEAGVRVAETSYLQKLRARCDSTGTLLVFDEIQTGLGRTGKLFAFEHSGIIPDILLLAKAFGGGMPLGAFISSPQIMESLSHHPPLGHITTFGGHPVSCAAGLANLREISESRIYETVQGKEKIFRESLSHPAIKEVRSAGLLIAIELESAIKVRKAIQACLDKGLLTDWFLFCDTAIRIAPPLIITEQQLTTAAQILNESLNIHA